MAVLLLKAYSYSDTMTAAIYFYYVLNSTTTYSSVYYTGHGSVPTFTPKSRRSRFQWVGRAFEGNGGGHVIERYVRPVYTLSLKGTRMKAPSHVPLRFCSQTSNCISSPVCPKTPRLMQIQNNVDHDLLRPSLNEATSSCAWCRAASKK